MIKTINMNKVSDPYIPQDCIGYNGDKIKTMISVYIDNIILHQYKDYQKLNIKMTKL
jgi:hypothetical protein